MYKEYESKGLIYKVDEYGNIFGKRGKIKQRLTDDGYCIVTIGATDKGRNLQLVHRIVAQLFIENNDCLKKEINHIDGNKENNYYKNLEWVTHKENMEHASKNKLFNDRRGSLNGRTKLTEKDVLKIRDLYLNGTHKSELKEKYNITTKSIENIVNYKTWKHI